MKNASSEETLIARARTLFVGTAERFGLHYEWDDTAPVGLACRYPKQPHLDFDLWMSLDGNEFICSGDHWFADIFPADDPEVWQRITDVVEGLVSGEARIALYTAVARSEPYWTEVQLCRDGR